MLHWFISNCHKPETPVKSLIVNCTFVLHLAEQGKSNLHVTSLEDAACRRPKERLSNGHSRAQVSKPARNIPRRHTLGGPRSSKEILGMQTSEMDRKREAFLEHLKQKYPHHATAIMGHQERLRDQVGAHCQSSWSWPSIEKYFSKLKHLFTCVYI